MKFHICSPDDDERITLNVPHQELNEPLEKYDQYDVTTIKCCNMGDNLDL